MPDFRKSPIAIWRVPLSRRRMEEAANENGRARSCALCRNQDWSKPTRTNAAFKRGGKLYVSDSALSENKSQRDKIREMTTREIIEDYFAVENSGGLFPDLRALARSAAQHLSWRMRLLTRRMKTRFSMLGTSMPVVRRSTLTAILGRASVRKERIRPPT